MESEAIASGGRRFSRGARLAIIDAGRRPSTIIFMVPMESLLALRTVLIRAQQAICAMGGHDYLLRSASGRMFLECADCGHETPGWRTTRYVAHTIARHED